MIKKIIPRLIKDKLLYIRLIAKVRDAKKKFNSALKEPKWLSHSDLEFLMQKYPIGKIQSYEPSALKKRAEERVSEMSKLMNHSVIKTLELGCYDAMVSAELQKGGKEATAIDIRDWLADEAKEAGVKHYVMNCHQMEFNDNSFDFIFSYDSFEHFSNPELVLKEAHRVLKKGGYLYLSFGNCYHSAKALHINDIINIPYVHLLFNKETLNNYVNENNLHSISYEFINNWTNKQFKVLWENYKGKLQMIKYQEFLNLNNLEIISDYPSCFKSKTNDFNDLIVNDFKILFKKIN